MGANQIANAEDWKERNVVVLSMKAWAFYRRSTDMQELSIDDQRRECRAFAAVRGWEIIREFVPEKGFASGLTIERDSCFQEIVRAAEIKTHGVKYLVVYDVSRFGRLAPEEKMGWEWHFRRCGIQITYVKDDFKNDGSIGDALLKVVKHSEAHQYSMKLSSDVLRGAKSHAALGHSNGGAAPYGYDRLLVDDRASPIKVLRRGEWKSTGLEHVVWTPSPTERIIVTQLFEDYAGGSGLRTLANGLNAKKILAPRGRHWSASQLYHLLRNRVYLGERHYNQRSYKAYRRGQTGSLFNPKNEWVCKISAHEAIIDLDLFDRAQARMKTWKTRVNGTHRKPYLLSGLATCGRCGYRMVGTPRRNGKGYRTLTYICSGYQRMGKSVCQGTYLRTEALEAAVVQAIREHLADPGWREGLESIVAGLVKEQFGFGAEKKASDLKRQLAAVEFEIRNLVDVVKGGHFSPALAEALRALESRQESLEKDSREAQGKALQDVSPQRMMAYIMTYADRFDDLWAKQGKPEERKELLQEFVRSIRVDHGDNTVKARIGLYILPAIKQNRVDNGVLPLSTLFDCGGPHLNNVEHAPVLYRDIVIKGNVLLNRAVA